MGWQQRVTAPRALSHPERSLTLLTDLAASREEREGLLRGTGPGSCTGIPENSPAARSDGGVSSRARSRLWLRFGSGSVPFAGSVSGGAQRDPAERGSARSCQDLPGASAHARPALFPLSLRVFLLSLRVFLLILFLVFFLFFPFRLLCRRCHGEAERGDAAVPVPGALQGADRGEQARAARPGRAGGRDPPVVPLPALGLRAGLFWGGPGSGRCVLRQPGWWGIGRAGNSWGCSGIL